MVGLGGGWLGWPEAVDPGGPAFPPPTDWNGLDRDFSITLIMSSLTVMVSLELGAPPGGTVLPGGGTCTTPAGDAPGGPTACPPIMVVVGTNGGLGMELFSVVIGDLMSCPAGPGCNSWLCCLTEICPGTPEIPGGAGGPPGKGGRVDIEVSLDIPAGIP